MKDAMVWLLVCTFFGCNAQNFEGSLYESVDHTEEILFSTNIEGPSVDKKGNLYVVNYQKDGTIGHVNADGSVVLFVTLPEGGTANSIQVDSKLKIDFADFTC